MTFEQLRSKYNLLPSLFFKKKKNTYRQETASSNQLLTLPALSERLIGTFDL